MSFLLVGHTKFAPDWCFGLFKQRYKRTFVSCLEDIAQVVETSADVNTSQLVGTQSGETIVPVYDWANFLALHFRKVPHIKSYHHFHFNALTPGTVTIKQYSDSDETAFNMLTDYNWYTSANDLPQVIPPSGLSSSRQWYLYQQIREFCRPGTEDLTCPKPPTRGCELDGDGVQDPVPSAKRGKK